jgi:hypothetical protein
MSSTSPPGVNDSWTRAREFATALGQAISDAQHERVGDARVIHYWDDDSLTLPVRGALELARTRQRDSDRLVQALFAAGFLGPVSLLRPHRSEFIGQIAVWDARRNETASAAKQPLERREMQAVARLTRLVGSTHNLNDEQLDAAVKALRDLSSKAFVHVQSMAGTWEERLARLIGADALIDMETYGPTLATLRSSNEFGVIAEELSNHRPRTSPLATAIDAAALTALIYMNRASGESSVYPRFFTSSSSLQRYHAESSWLRDQLSFDLPDGSGRGSVWRTNRYYFLRALFPELRLNRDEATAPDADGTSLARLQDLLSTIEEAIDAGPTSLFQLLEGDVHGEHVSLARLIDDFEQSRMSRVWLTFDVTSLPKRMVKSLAGLSRLNDDERVRIRARLFEENVERKLEQELADYRISARMVAAVSRAVHTLANVKDRRHVLAGDHIHQQLDYANALSLKVDLASVRWGIDYSDERDVVRLTPSGEPDSSEVLRTFDLSSLRQDDEESLRAMAILVGLEEFDLANELVTQLRMGSESKHNTVAHHLLELVSILGSRRRLSEQELSFIFDYVRNQYEAQPTQSSLLTLGYAYAAFAAWFRSAHGGAWAFSDPKDELGWAAWSLQVVRKCQNDLPPLARLFAVNHIVYVSTCLGLTDPEVDLLMLDLERLARLLDEYRFLDTVGFALLRRATVLASTGTTDRDDLIRLNKRAIEHLERAAELRPVDVEVRQHLELARDHMRSLNAVQR